MATPTEPVYCLRHRDTETGLRCARCNDPICPECMVQAAVGHICPSCVTWERNPVAQVAGSRLVAAVGAGLGAGLLIAIAVTVLSALFGGFFTLILWAVAGFLIGQAVHIAANRSRARSLRYVAGGSAAFSWAVAAVFIGVSFTLLWLVFAAIQVAIAITLAISPFR
ncbi:MAG: hypothetical protein OXC55_02915 [Chloroflexi bacterium]|nr:hypothetical protein [Chloroflexota bacterium]